MSGNVFCARAREFFAGAPFSALLDPPYYGHSKSSTKWKCEKWYLPDRLFLICFRTDTPFLSQRLMPASFGKKKYERNAPVQRSSWRQGKKKEGLKRKLFLFGCQFWKCKKNIVIFPTIYVANYAKKVRLWCFRQTTQGYCEKWSIF